MDCQINRIDVWPMARGGTSVCWSLSENFFPKGPLHFYVDFGRAGTDTWIALNSQPIIDECCFIDVCQRSWELVNDGYYRIRMLRPEDPNCPLITSAPISSNGRLNKQDWLRAREIVRKEYLQMKFDGIPGFLLKRKKFGVACPNCLEHDTREVIDSNCPICFGVGIVGGYYPGVLLSMRLQNAGESDRRLTLGPPPQGMNADATGMYRCVDYPILDTRDVWVQADSDGRHIIDKIASVASYRGLQLIVTPTLKLAPATDIVYSVPIEGGSSSAQVAQCDVRKGLASKYEDWS